MAMFLTKVWGFGEPCGPLQFGQPGWRDRAREELEDDDLVILVGTYGNKTDEDDKGRILGMMEPTKNVVLWTDFALSAGPEDFNERGEYKWPYGLLNRRAWVFEDPRPNLKDISDRHFNMDSAAGIVPLNADEAARILTYPRREIALLKPLQVQARLDGSEAARRRNAPPPTPGIRRSIMQMRRAPAYTYAMRISNASLQSVKIGWAFDYKQRQRQFNQYALPQLGGLTYEAFLYQLWPTAMEAFLMEQSLLRKFDAQRHPQNREVVFEISPEQIEEAWKDYIARKGKKIHTK